MKSKQEEFKALHKKEVVPRVKKMHKLLSEINKLDSESDKLNSKSDKLNSKSDKFLSERHKLLSGIFMLFHKFEKKYNCIVDWKDYDFKIEDITIKEEEN